MIAWIYLYSNRWSYAAALCLLLAAGVLLVLLASRQTLSVELAADYNSYQCSTGSAGDGEFRILTLLFDGARELADALCDDPRISADFASVNIAWRARDFLQASHIVGEQFDYLWSREHLIAGLVPGADRYYAPIVTTPHYSVYLFARAGTISLSADYFADKTVGFLQDSHSQTYYVQPFLALKQAGITLADSRKRYYRDVQGLVQALHSGEVDVIPGTEGTVPAAQSPEFDRLQLRADMHSGNWYLLNRWLDGRLECVLLEQTSRQKLFALSAWPTAHSSHCTAGG